MRETMIRKALNFILNPQKIIFKAWKHIPIGSYRLRLDYDIFPRPHYAFCVYHAAKLAEKLGYDKISIAEFGVAGGAGLLELEKLAAEVEKEFSVKIEIYGFDTGEGLPEPVGYKDLKYIWKEGFYKMDQDALRAKLSRSKLVIGNVKDTVPSFYDEFDAAPLAAAFLDLDFWSSTSDALNIFDKSDDHKLPRVFCYFDDVGSAEDGGLLNDYVGQLASINEYNASHETAKVTKISGFNHIRKIPAAWNDKIYVHHAFEHQEYNTYIHKTKNRQLKI